MVLSYSVDGTLMRLKIPVTLFLSFLFILTVPCKIVALPQMDDCLSCHGEKDMGRLYINVNEFKASIHRGLSCVDCHSDVSELPHPEKLKRVACQTCHEDVYEKYARSIHGKERAKGEEMVATCSDCHGKHNILPSSNPQSLTYPVNLPQTCSRCHEDEKITQEKHIPITNPYRSYSQSIHGKAVLERKSMMAPTCSSCHGSHDIFLSNEPDSKTNRNNIPKLCGTCHYGIYETYIDSVHGIAFRKGAQDSPVCTNCHGEHLIQPSTEPSSLVYSAEISRTTCPQCHAAERIIKKYGLPSDRVTTYMDSYHGLADRYGDTTVANCASCHGIHNIYASTDPRSTIFSKNLIITCGKCHPGASENFAKGKIHSTIIKTKDLSGIVKYYVRLFYLILIPVIIIGMVGHNILDYAYRLRQKRIEMSTAKTYLRLSLSERIQHLVMFLSFITLVISGFALRLKLNLPFFSGEINSIIRSTTHRVAASIFIIISIYHVGYLLKNKRGRELIKDIMPALKDIKDVLGAIAVYLGIKKEFPRMGRFTYIEKSEYFALVWGAVIMIATGLIMWFEEFFMRYIPKWGVDVASMIHYYEAILATLAIIVWHFYHVHIKPGAKYTNIAWLTGELTEEEMKEEHPLEMEEEEKGRT
jgi:formate dehydrogenase gamma subunit